VIFIERTFELSGAEGLGAKPRPELIGPVLTHLHASLIVLRAGEPSSYNRIWGVIPGEESEAEFAEAVEAFS